MNENVTREHYARLAATYDENWAYSPEFIEWMTGAILRRLRITDHQVIDASAAAPACTREARPLAAAVACADPSAAMLAQLPHAAG